MAEPDPLLPQRPSFRKVRFVCVSDTHNSAPGQGFTLPKGDVLIHAGDLTNQGSYNELKKALEWIANADFSIKIIVAGNHDLSLDPSYGLKYADGWRVAADRTEDCRRLVASHPDITYLQHAGATIQLPGTDPVTFRVYGSPYSTDREGENWAFQYREERSADVWGDVPADTEVLITHTPPAGHCDASKHWREGGCRSLKETISRVRPMLHVCGHCHEGRGVEIVHWGDEPDTPVSVAEWVDPGAANKKQSLLDLTGSRNGSVKLEVGIETAVVNASIMAKSWGGGAKAFNKPIVVDVNFPIGSTK